MWGFLPELDAALCDHVNAEICCLVLFKIPGVVRRYDDEFLYLVICSLC
jgi:hypothetical protein